MVGDYCRACWLGECERVLLAHIAPVSLVDCPCCQHGHEWADVNSAVTSSRRPQLRTRQSPLGRTR